MLLLCVLVYKMNPDSGKCFCLCVDAAGIHEEGDVLFTGKLLCPGSFSNTHNEKYDNMPQRRLVYHQSRRKAIHTFKYLLFKKKM